jgi:hypothetical protein
VRVNVIRKQCRLIHFIISNERFDINADVFPAYQLQIQAAVGAVSINAN